MPNEPAESDFKAKVKAVAYPSAEFGGFVWIYMGPPDKQPACPNYHWCTQPDAERSQVRKWMQESNYSQGVEGDLDSAHVSFLHRKFDQDERPDQLRRAAADDHGDGLRLRLRRAASVW